VFDVSGTFERQIKAGRVILQRLAQPQEIQELHRLMVRHVAYTKSHRGREILKHWDKATAKFWMIVPTDYLRMRQSIRQAEKAGMTTRKAAMHVFEVRSHNALCRLCSIVRKSCTQSYCAATRFGLRLARCRMALAHFL